MQGDGARTKLAFSLIAALTAATSPARPEDSWRSRVVPRLLALYDSAAQSAASPTTAAAAAAPFSPRIDADGRVQIDVHFDCAMNAPVAALQAAGVLAKASVKIGPLCVVEGWAAPSQLAQIAAVQGTVRVQVPSYALRPVPSPSTGQLSAVRAPSRVTGASATASGIDGNGVSIIRADQFVSQTTTTGAGATVGVQSTGVASLALIQARGELPAVQVLNPSGGSSASSLDEGTALLEEVHAVAPGAKLAFCGPETFIDYTSCLTQLIAAGASILVDDINFLPEDLMSSQGTDSQAVTTLLMQNPNVALFTVTGNSNGSYWEGAYAPVPVATAGLPPLSCTSNGTTQVDNYVAAFNGNYSEQLTAEEESEFPLAFAWADPAGQNVSNFDLYLFSDGYQTACFSATGSSSNLISTSLYSSYTLYVGTPDTSLAGKLLKLWAGGDGLTALSPASNGGIVSPQAFASGVITVGAVDGADGVGDSIENFSTEGPISVAFPTPLQLQAPTLVAPDGIYVDAVGTAFENYLFPDGNFYGTSASVPNVGGVAALLRGAFPSLSVPQLNAVLQSGAVALGTAIPNTTFGYGRVDALGALGAILPLPTMSALSDSTIVGGASSQPIAFTASGFGRLHFSVASSNSALVPAAVVPAGTSGVSISPAGCGTSTLSCTLVVTPAIGQVGSATVTVSARDGANRPAPATMTVAVTRPAPPTLSVNSGAMQEFTAGSGSAAPIAFAITGTGPLTVTASSSNTQLFPAAALFVSPGCGSTVNTCTLALTPASGFSGSGTITLTVLDEYGQSMTGTATLQVDPGTSSSAGSSASADAGHGGGGAFGWWELAGLASLCGRAVRRRAR
jgi:hypothetical protein